MTPLQHLIDTRMKQLGIRRGELAKRCGFRNIAKGVRRIDAVYRGDLASRSAKMVLNALPSALSTDRSAVEAAVRDTASALGKARHNAAIEIASAKRASFIPHAYLLGTERRPTQLFIYGATGGSRRWLKLTSDLSRPPVTFATQAHSIVKRTPRVPFFGRTTGFVINYAPNRAVRFDLDGKPVQELDQAYEPAQVDLLLRGKQLSGEAFAATLGSRLNDPH